MTEPAKPSVTTSPPEEIPLTLRTTSSHDQWRVVSTEFLHAYFSNLPTNVGKDTRNLCLQCLLLVTTGLILQLSSLCQFDELLTLEVGSLDKLILLRRENGPRDDIVDPQREAEVG